MTVFKTLSIMDRRRFIFGGLASALLVRDAAAAQKKRKRPVYQGSELVEFYTPERPGTVIVDTYERALFHVIGGDAAIRYGVAVGKQGFDWSGIAEIGRKQTWPRWTPPKSMIARKPELAKWANGKPGGPENPLGARALYL